ncbi:MAG: hypothetical protein U9N59_13475 [Campylobacterota bacterium]|nr:hypothetical protein [Campylobacterota bacterium]
MNLNKILVFLLALVFYINYENYFKIDTQKLYNEKVYIKNKILQEESILINQKSFIKNNINLDTLMYSGKEFNYSKAMGEMQSSITKSSENICKIKALKWISSGISEKWYDTLRINLSLKCTPNNFVRFMDNLKSTKKLYNIENFNIRKDGKDDILNINIKLVGYRTKINV